MIFSVAGAEKIREVLIQRQLQEQARAREERLSKQAYKESLDVKVFEEELDASRRRRGGPNPHLSTREDGVTVVDFSFFSNHPPLRFAATGNFVFLPIHVGTVFAPKIAALKCPRKHTLTNSSHNINCSLCGTKGIQGYCRRSECLFQVCVVC